MFKSKFNNEKNCVDAPIKQQLDFEGLRIIRVYPDDDNLDTYPQEKLNRNVYAIDSNGKVVWQIQEAPHGGAGNDKAYMHIMIKKGKLIAGNWIGVDYIVNSESGLVTPCNIGQRPW